MKRLTLILAVAATLAAFPVNRGLVTDDAHVFTPEEVSALETKLRAFEAATSVEFAVVTVPSLDGLTIDEYRVRLFEVWKIGKRGKDNGLLMVVAPNEPPSGKIGIEVGYGLEPLLTDAAVGTIIRETIRPGWRSAHRANGVIAGADAIMTRLRAKPPEAVTTVTPVPAASSGPSGAAAFFWVLFAIVGIITAGTVGVIVTESRKRRAQAEMDAERLRRDAYERAQDDARRRDRLRKPVAWSEPHIVSPPDPVAGKAYWDRRNALKPPRTALTNPEEEERRRDRERRRRDEEEEEARARRRREESSSYSSSYDSGSSSSSDAGSSSSSSYDFGGGGSGGGGSSSDL